MTTELNVKITSEFDDAGFRRTKEAADELTADLTNIARAINGVTTGTTQRLSEPLKALNKEVKEAARGVTKEMDNIAKSFGKISAESAKLNNKVKDAMDGAKNGSRGAVGGINDLNKTMANLDKTALRLNTALVDGFKKSIDAIEHAKTASQNLESSRTNLAKAEEKLARYEAEVQRIMESGTSTIEEREAAQVELTKMKLAAKDAQDKLSQAERESIVAQKGLAESIKKTSLAHNQALKIIDQVNDGLEDDELIKNSEGWTTLTRVVNAAGVQIKMVHDVQARLSAQMTENTQQGERLRQVQIKSIETQSQMKIALDQARTAAKEKIAADREAQAVYQAQLGILAKVNQAYELEQIQLAKNLTIYNKMDAATLNVTKARQASEDAINAEAAAERELQAMIDSGTATVEQRIALERKLADAKQRSQQANSTFRASESELKGTITGVENTLRSLMTQMTKYSHLVGQLDLSGAGDLPGGQIIRTGAIELLERLSNESSDLTQHLTRLKTELGVVQTEMQSTSTITSKLAANQDKLKQHYADVAASVKAETQDLKFRNSVLEESIKTDSQALITLDKLSLKFRDEALMLEKSSAATEAKRLADMELADAQQRLNAIIEAGVKPSKYDQTMVQQKFAEALKQSNAAISKNQQALSEASKRVDQYKATLLETENVIDKLSRALRSSEMTFGVDNEEAQSLRETIEMYERFEDRVRSAMNTAETNVDQYRQSLEAATNTMKQATQGGKLLQQTLAHITDEENKLKGAANSKNKAMNDQSKAFVFDTQKAQALIRVMQALVAFFERATQVIMKLAQALGAALVSALNKAAGAMNHFSSGASKFANMVKALDATGKSAKRMGSDVASGMGVANNALNKTATAYASFMAGQDAWMAGQRILGTMVNEVDQFTTYEKAVNRAAIAAGEETRQNPQIIDEIVTEIMRGGYDAAPIYGFNQEELAQGLYFYASAIGQKMTTENASQVTEALLPMLELSQWSQTAPETVIKGVLNAVQEFGIDAHDLETAGPAIKQTAQLFGYLANASSMEIPDIIEFFKMTGPLAGKLVEGDSMNALNEVMGFSYMASEMGLRGGNPGRGLAQLLSSILDPTKEMDKSALKFFGQDVRSTFLNEDGKLKNGMQSLVEPFLQMSEGDWLAAQAELFTQNASRAIIPFIEQARIDPDKFYRLLGDLEGKEPSELLGAVSDNTRDTLFGNIQNLANAFDTFVNTIIRSIDGPLKSALKGLADIFWELGDVIRHNEFIGQFFTALAAGIGIAASIAGALLTVGGALMIMRAAMAGAGTAVGVVTGFFSALPIILGAVIPLLLAIGTAAVLLKTAWDTNFLGMRDSLQSLRESFADGSFDDNFQETINNIVVSVQRGYRAFSEFVNGILLGIGPTNNLGAALKAVFGDLIGGAAYEGLLKFSDRLIEVRNRLAKWYADLGQNPLDKFFKGLAASTQMFFEVLLFGISDIRIRQSIVNLGNLIGFQLTAKIAGAANVIRNIIGDIIDTFQGMWSVIFGDATAKELFVGLIAEIQSVLGSIFSDQNIGMAVQFGTSLAQGIAEGFTAGLVAIKQAAQVIADFLARLPAQFSSAGNAVSGFVQNLTGMDISLQGLGRTIGMVLGAGLAGKLALSLVPMAGLFKSAALGATAFAASLVSVTAKIAATVLSIIAMVLRLGIQATLLAVNTTLTLGLAAAKFVLATASAAASAGATTLSIALGAVGLAMGVLTLGLPILLAGLALAFSRSAEFRESATRLASVLGGKLWNSLKSVVEKISDLAIAVADTLESSNSIGDALGSAFNPTLLSTALTTFGMIASLVTTIASALWTAAEGAIKLAGGLISAVSPAEEIVASISGLPPELQSKVILTAAISMWGSTTGPLGTLTSKGLMNLLQDETDKSFAKLSGQELTGQELIDIISSNISDQVRSMPEGAQQLELERASRIINDLLEAKLGDNYELQALAMPDAQSIIDSFNAQFLAPNDFTQQMLESVGMAGFDYSTVMLPISEAFGTDYSVLDSADYMTEMSLSELRKKLVDFFSSMTADVASVSQKYGPQIYDELNRAVQQFLGVNNIDVRGWTAERWTQFFGIPGAEAALAEFTPVMLAAKEEKKKFIDEAGLDTKDAELISDRTYDSIESIRAGLYQPLVEEATDAGSEAADAFSENFKAGLEALKSASVGQILDWFSPQENFSNIYEALANYQDALKNALPDDIDPSLNYPIEVLADIAGFKGPDGSGFTFDNVFGKNVDTLLDSSPGVQFAMENLGLDLEQLKAELPKYFHDSGFVPYVTAALVKQFAQIPTSVYQKLDDFGAEFNNGIGLPFQDLVEYSISKAQGGEKGSLLDFAMQEWGLTYQQAQDYLNSEFDGKPFDFPDQFWQDVQDFVASGGGQLAALTADTWAEINDNLVQGTDKALAFTEKEWAALPDYIKAALQAAGYQIGIFTDEQLAAWNDALGGKLGPALEEGLTLGFAGLDAEGKVQSYIIDPITGAHVPLPAIDPASFLFSLKKAKEDAIKELMDVSATNFAENQGPASGSIEAFRLAGNIDEATKEYDALAQQIQDAVKNASTDGINEGVAQAATEIDDTLAQQLYPGLEGAIFESVVNGAKRAQPVIDAILAGQPAPTSNGYSGYGDFNPIGTGSTNEPPRYLLPDYYGGSGAGASGSVGPNQSSTPPASTPTAEEAAAAGTSAAALAQEYAKSFDATLAPLIQAAILRAVTETPGSTGGTSAASGSAGSGGDVFSTAGTAAATSYASGFESIIGQRLPAAIAAALGGGTGMSTPTPGSTGGPASSGVGQGIIDSIASGIENGEWTKVKETLNLRISEALGLGGGESGGGDSSATQAGYYLVRDFAFGMHSHAELIYAELEAIKTSISTAFTAIETRYNLHNTTVNATILETMTAIKNTVLGNMLALTNSIRMNLDLISSLFSQAMDQINAAIVNGMRYVVHNSERGGLAAIAALRSALGLDSTNKAYLLGLALSEGFAQGILDGSWRAVNAAALLAGKAIESARKTGEISSPSRVMMELGKFFGEGFALGIEETGDEVEGKSAGVAEQAIQAFFDSIRGEQQAVADATEETISEGVTEGADAATDSVEEAATDVAETQAKTISDAVSTFVSDLKNSIIGAEGAKPIADVVSEYSKNLGEAITSGFDSAVEENSSDLTLSSQEDTLAADAEATGEAVGTAYADGIASGLSTIQDAKNAILESLGFIIDAGPDGSRITEDSLVGSIQANAKAMRDKWFTKIFGFTPDGSNKGTDLGIGAQGIGLALGGKFGNSGVLGGLLNAVQDQTTATQDNTDATTDNTDSTDTNTSSTDSNTTSTDAAWERGNAEGYDAGFYGNEAAPASGDTQYDEGYAKGYDVGQEDASAGYEYNNEYASALTDAAESTSSAADSLDNAASTVTSLQEEILKRVQESMGIVSDSASSMGDSVSDAVSNAVAEMQVDTINASTLNVGGEVATDLIDTGTIDSGTVDTSTIDSSSSSDDGYTPRDRPGTDRSNDVDYTSGYSAGYDDGYAIAEQDPETGNRQYDEGYQKGYDRGCEDIRNGYEYRNRYAEGYADGTTDTATGSDASGSGTSTTSSGSLASDVASATDAANSLASATESVRGSAEEIAAFLGEDFMADFREAFGPADVTTLISDALTTGVSQGITDTTPAIADATTNLVNDTIDAGAAAAGASEGTSTVSESEIGTPIGEGVSTGIRNCFPIASDAMTNLVNHILNTGRQAIGTSSDTGDTGSSTVAADQIGVPIAKGIADGIRSYYNELRVAIVDSINGIINAGEAAASAQASDITDTLSTEVTDGVDEMSTEVGSSMESLGDQIRKQVEESLAYLSKLGDGAQSTATQVDNALSDTADAVETNASDTADTVNETADGGTATATDTGSTVSETSASATGTDDREREAKRTARKEISKQRELIATMRKSMNKAQQIARQQMAGYAGQGFYEIVKQLNSRYNVLEGGFINDAQTGEMYATAGRSPEQIKKLLKALGLQDAVSYEDLQSYNVFDTNDTGGYNDVIAEQVAWMNNATAEEMNAVTREKSEQVLNGVEEAQAAIEETRTQLRADLREIRKTIDTINTNTTPANTDTDRDTNTGTGGGGGGDNDGGGGGGDTGGGGGGDTGGGMNKRQQKAWDKCAGKQGKDTSRECCSLYNKFVAEEGTWVWKRVTGQGYKCTRDVGLSQTTTPSTSAAFSSIGGFTSVLPQPTISTADEVALASRNTADAAGSGSSPSGDSPLEVHFHGNIVIEKEADIDALVNRIDRLLGHKYRIAERMNPGSDIIKR